jgi:CHRD domain
MQMSFVRPAFTSLALGALVFAATPVFADTVSYKAELKASAEVPPNDSKGNGTLDAAYDTTSKKLIWTITYAGSTGPATAAHFHGPAAAGSNAPPVVPLSGTLTSPIKGDATLTEAQLADLQAGRWYLNIHTADHKDGELRGQVMKN